MCGGGSGGDDCEVCTGGGTDHTGELVGAAGGGVYWTRYGGTGGKAWP
jgi:hypothetical protein